MPFFVAGWPVTTSSKVLIAVTSVLIIVAGALYLFPLGGQHLGPVTPGPTLASALLGTIAGALTGPRRARKNRAVANTRRASLPSFSRILLVLTLVVWGVVTTSRVLYERGITLPAILAMAVGLVPLGAPVFMTAYIVTYWQELKRSALEFTHASEASAPGTAPTRGTGD